MGAVNAAALPAALGWRVLPLQPGGKRPLGGLGLHDATADPATVEAWRARWPRANVGVACAASGLAVLDVDPRDGGDDELWRLERQLGPLPRTVEALTGGGGRHVYLAHPGGDLRGALAPGVEVKARHYVVAPPSVHPSGRGYEWSVDGHPDEVPVAPAPPAWAAAMLAPAEAPRLAAPRADAAPRGRDGLDSSGDPLLEIPPAAYVERLTGRRVGRDGKATCPFHKGGQERTPSLHAYPTGDRGWYCFGCRRGGTIYDLAALLGGYDPASLRAADFLIVRNALWDFFGLREATAA